MADHPPSGTLPTFYGEKTSDGRVVKRPSPVTTAEDQEALVSSPGTTATAAPKGPQISNMAFEEGGPLHDDRPSADKRQRWTMDDPRFRTDDYWREQWGRRRWERERERDWYPEYRGPQRYIEWEPEERRVPPRAYLSSGSRRSNCPVHYRPPRRSYDGYRRYDSDEEYDEEFYPKRAAGGGGGGVRVNGEGGDPPAPPPTEPESMRLPLTGWMGAFKGHFVAFLGELVGTTMFLYFAFAGTQVANIGSSNNQSSTTGQTTGFNVSVLLYIALVFGFSLAVNVWVFFRISGGLFNPAVTLAMAMTQGISWLRAMLLFAAQLSGGMLASILVKVMFPTQFNVRTTLSAGTSLVRGVFIEGVLTFELVFTIFMLAKEKHRATFIAPVGIGLALFVAELAGIYYTGGSLNPARSFGPCVVTGMFDPEHWIYWVGPGGGAVVAVLFYKFIKILEYEIANPGQDEESAAQATAAAVMAKKA